MKTGTERNTEAMETTGLVYPFTDFRNGANELELIETNEAWLANNQDSDDDEYCDVQYSIWMDRAEIARIVAEAHSVARVDNVLVGLGFEGVA